MSRDLTDALSKLFIKLGGKTSDSKENKGPVDYIDDITNIVEPGDGSGDSGVLLIPYTIGGDETTGPIITVSKTFSEMRQAWKDGKTLIARSMPYTAIPSGETSDFYDTVCTLNLYTNEQGETDLSAVKIGQYYTIFANDGADIVIRYLEIIINSNDYTSIRMNEWSSQNS